LKEGVGIVDGHLGLWRTKRYGKTQEKYEGKRAQGEEG